MGPVTYSKNLTGTEVARLSWEIPDSAMPRLLSGGHDSEETRHDVRSQFAMWASDQPRTVFPTMSDAWNAFVAPKAGIPTPAVLIPSAICHECSRKRHRVKDFTKPGYADCTICHGSGRKPPQAVPASYTVPEDFPAALFSTADTDAAL